MNLRSCLPTFPSSSISTSGDSAAPSPPPKSLISDAGITFSPDSQTNSSSTSSSSSSTSIQTTLSLLTLPSVPSLQKLTLSPQNDAAHPPTITLLALLIPTPRAAVNFLTLHNNLLYAASGDQVNAYRTSDAAVVHTFAGGAGAVKSVAFHAGKIYTAHQDCRIRVWKPINDQKHTHKLIATLPTLGDRLRRFVSPRNYIETRRHRRKLYIHHYDVVSGLARNESHVFSVSWDKSIKIWNNHHRCLQSIRGAHDDAINAVVVSDDGSIVYTGSADKRIKVWKNDNDHDNDNKKRFVLIATLEKHKSAVNALALSRDGSVLFSGSCDRAILVWEREDGANSMAVVGALRGHEGAVLCLINVGDLLVSGSGDRTVRMWRRGGFDGRYRCLAVLDGHRAPVRAVAAEEEEEGGGRAVKVFSGGSDGEIRVWRVEVASGVKGCD